MSNALHATSRPVEQVLSDLRGDAATYRRRGDVRFADLMERIAEEVEVALEDYRRWLSEDEAMLKSGHRRAWFRSRRGEWLAAGNARVVGRRWFYRFMIVPQRGNASAAYEAGLEEGEVA